MEIEYPLNTPEDVPSAAELVAWCRSTYSLVLYSTNCILSGEEQDETAGWCSSTTKTEEDARPMVRFRESLR
jgi:hypothetical protein